MYLLINCCLLFFYHSFCDKNCYKDCEFVSQAYTHNVLHVLGVTSIDLIQKIRAFLILHRYSNRVATRSIRTSDIPRRYCDIIIVFTLKNKFLKMIPSTSSTSISTACERFFSFRKEINKVYKGY